MKPRNIELHIEALILHGFAPEDRSRIGEAVESELAWLFVKQGVPFVAFAHNIAAVQMDAGVFHVTPDLKAEAIGAQVAWALYRGLQQ